MWMTDVSKRQEISRTHARTAARPSLATCDVLLPSFLHAFSILPSLLSSQSINHCTGINLPSLPPPPPSLSKPLSLHPPPLFLFSISLLPHKKTSRPQPPRPPATCMLLLVARPCCLDVGSGILSRF